MEVLPQWHSLEASGVYALFSSSGSTLTSRIHTSTLFLIEEEMQRKITPNSRPRWLLYKHCQSFVIRHTLLLKVQSNKKGLKALSWRMFLCIIFILKVSYYAKSTFSCILYINMCPLCVKRFWKFQEKRFAHFLSWSIYINGMCNH